MTNEIDPCPVLSCESENVETQKKPKDGGGRPSVLNAIDCWNVLINRPSDIEVLNRRNQKLVDALAQSVLRRPGAGLENDIERG